MAEDAEPTFMVDVSSRPVLVQIRGRANFLNCSPLRTFFKKMVDDGKSDFLLDFSNCKGMDSTFLGILAGAALDSRKTKPQGSIRLANLDKRNMELVKNLGLQRIVTILEPPVASPTSLSQRAEGLSAEVQSEEEKKEMLISAHEDLVEIDKANFEKFQDLLTFLREEE